MVGLKTADRFVLLAAEGFGLGRISVAPGTFGSLWAFPIGWGLHYFAVPWSLRLVIWIAMVLFGIPLTGRAAVLRGRKDPGSIVWDEIAAFPLVYAFVPISWTILVIGFVLFRIFDIAKPWPIRTAERLPSGTGIMADDQIAAMYASAILSFIAYSMYSR
jgi:phosphatidylglycerophosphatase A